MLPESITTLMRQVAGQELRAALEDAITNAISAAADKARTDAQDAARERRKCNGWTNYATWRINLEIWSDYDWSDERGTWNDAGELAGYLEERTDDYVTNFGEHEDGLALDYARAFVHNVDWYELAEHIIADNPDVILSDEDDTEGDA